MIDFIWDIKTLECINKDDKEKVVTTAHWTLTGADEGNTAYRYGSITIPYNNSDNFIPYSTLNKNDVINWVKEAIGANSVSNMESSLVAELDLLKNPIITMPPLPWTTV